jgi:putative tributyrin esterase
MAKLTCNFISYTLKRTVDITVVIPTMTIPESMAMGAPMAVGAGMKMPKPEFTKYVGRPKFPVLYLLHGMGNNHATWTGYTNVEMYAEERNIAVVMISAENKSYINNNSGDNFYDFIEDELMDFIKGNFNVSDRPEDTYIAGLSMGGYGTLVHALSNPDKFAAFGALSAAVELNPAALSGSSDKSEIDPKYDPKTLAEGLYKAGTKFPKIYIAVGGKDFLFKANEDFKNRLIEMGNDVTWDTIPEYGHEWRFWNIEIEKFLDWIPRTDYYAAKGKRQI